MERIVLLNADYTFLNTVTWKRAMILLTKGKVEILKYGDRFINGIIQLPAVLRLTKFIRTIYKTRVPFSKRNVMIRDGFQCTYCGIKGDERTKKYSVYDEKTRAWKTEHFTIDHVKPKMLDGKSTFENCVTSCKPCNNKKGHKSCVAAQMWPKTKLVAPTISEFLRLRMETLGLKDIMKEIFAAT